MNILVRLLGAGDEASTDAFLAPHTHLAYFIRSNAYHAGLVHQGKPYQADYFGAFDQEKLIGILAHNWFGFVQVFTVEQDIIPDLVAVWRKHLALHPRRIIGFSGVSEQIRILKQEAGILPSALRDGGMEDTLFTLSLAEMKAPDIASHTRPATPGDIEQMVAWRYDYNIEALGEKPNPELTDKSRSEVTRRLQEGDFYILEIEGRPVSWCGVSGFLPDWKNVGPVWTPPDQRGKGYGRAVTAGALAAKQAQGATHAVLFTNTVPAEKAYRALGFKEAGNWILDFMLTPVVSL